MKKHYVAIFVGILTIAPLSLLAGDTLPKGWFKAGSDPSDYKVGVDESVVFDGNRSAFIEADSAESEAFATLMQNSSAEGYLGERVQLTLYIKTQDISGWTGGWFRIDDGKKEVLAFDNMNNRPIKKNTDWAKYTMVLDVPTKATKMAYGVLLNGNGKVWFDNLSFEIVDENTPVTDLYAIKREKKLTKNLSFEND